MDEEQTTLEQPAAPETAAPEAEAAPETEAAPEAAASREKKTAVYVCTGCWIGESINAQGLVQVAESEFQLAAKEHPPLCVPEGVEFLQKDIQESGADRVVIAACSQRVNWDVFSPENLDVKLVERANIRELVAWSKPANEERTQELAEDYLRMGIASVQGMEPPTPTIGEVVESLLVVGGGIAGMTAALEAAEAGHDVVLVEKQPALGGWLAQFHKLYPTRSPYRDLWTLDLDARIRTLNEHPRVKVYTGAEIKNISGEPGTFQVTVQQDGNAIEFQAGAVVMASGWQPREEGLERLGYGKYANVITNVQLEAMAKAGKITRPSDGKPPRRVVFLQRPGLSEEQRFSYGCNVVDMASLKQALYIRELDPSSEVYIVYEDLVALGTYEAFYRRVQEEPGVYFTKGDVAAVSEDGKGNLVLELEHSLLGEKVGVRADLVVLATGMIPSTADSSVLNLLYKQGPGLPTTKFGFSDSNFICFPYETRRTGLYAAGSVREPMDVKAAIDDATGAALKAIQSLQLVSKGEATHPRSGDLSLPITRLQGCTKCGRCSEECPFSAIEVEESGYPKLSPDRCRRCGICMGACPVRVISFENYSVEQTSAMIKAMQFPEDEEKPRILALACENDAYPAFDMAGINRMNYDASVRVIPLRCLGSLNVAVVADAISSGVDGIMLIGCKSGDDYQCHFIQGSELAGKRMENVKETLSRLMVEPERVKPLELEITEYDLIPGMVSEFVDEIKKIGLNPYKGF